jgi:stress response protein YsnF
MGQTVIGIFEDSSDAYKAVEKLTTSGFSRSEIDISENDNNEQVNTDSDDKNDDSISRFFSNLFGNSDESRNYSEVSRRSSSIVTVHAQSKDEAHRAASILDDNGAIDVDERAAQYGYSSDADLNRDKSSSIPVIEEEMHVGKREVETGGARIRSRIVEKPVEETLRLRKEKVDIERNPVNRPASEKDMEHFKEGEIDATERSEEPVVNKEARVVEEVKIKRDVEEVDEKVRERVRKSEVDVEYENKGKRNKEFRDKDKLNKEFHDKDMRKESDDDYTDEDNRF